MSFAASRDLPTITLEELEGRAALTRRVERKYVLYRSDAERLLEMLPSDARVLEIDGQRSFEYSSVYFDTPSRDAYLATAHRRRRRFKVRTRQYVRSGATFVEVKTRRGRFTVKERTEYDCTERLTPTARAYVTARLCSAHLDDIDTAALEPALRTSYRRTTLYLADTDSRVTVDTDLSFSTSVGGRLGRVLELPDHAIVETKTAGSATSVDRILWSLGMRPTSVSKFGTGLAAVESELPRTRWSRLLRTQFDAPAPAFVDGRGR